MTMRRKFWTVESSDENLGSNLHIRVSSPPPIQLPETRIMPATSAHHHCIHLTTHQSRRSSRIADILVCRASTSDWRIYRTKSTNGTAAALRNPKAFVPAT